MNLSSGDLHGYRTSCFVMTVATRGVVIVPD
jgi:hypothetical protein